MNANIKKHLVLYAQINLIYWYDKYCMAVNMQLLRLHRQANNTETLGNKTHNFLKGLTVLIFKNPMFQAVYVSHLTCAALVCCGIRLFKWQSMCFYSCRNNDKCFEWHLGKILSCSKKHLVCSEIAVIACSSLMIRSESDSGGEREREGCCRFSGASRVLLLLLLGQTR